MTCSILWLHPFSGRRRIPERFRFSLMQSNEGSGIGHGAVDSGMGYTYFNPKTGQEFSGVLGFTYNTTNRSTRYQNGVDMHFDWGASQFLTKQFQIGLVGYVYDEIGCDSGSGDRVGCFQSRVISIGPQVGFVMPLSTTTQGYLNIKGYKARHTCAGCCNPTRAITT